MFPSKTTKYGVKSRAKPSYIRVYELSQKHGMPKVCQLGQLKALLLEAPKKISRPSKTRRNMLQSGYKTKSKESIQRATQKEIEKCEVRCANCHRRKTASERGGYRETRVT